MSEVTAKDIVCELETFFTPENWSEGSPAQNAAGGETSVYAEDARTFCLIGGIAKVIYDKTGEKALPERFYSSSDGRGKFVTPTPNGYDIESPLMVEVVKAFQEQINPVTLPFVDPYPLWKFNDSHDLEDIQALTRQTCKALSEKESN